MGNSRASRFLDAFNRIERLLGGQVASNGDYETFSALVRESREFTQNQKFRLYDLARLRNTIVHHPGGWGGDPIADPREDVVGWIEEQAEILENPPRVIPTLKLQPPRVLSWNADLSDFFDEIRLHEFSQSPVRSEDGGLSLITTNAVARWVASDYTSDVGVALENATVGEVLEHAEAEDQVVVRGRDLKVVEAALIFAGGEAGIIPSAIVMTDNANPKNKPLGICVRSDVARLLRALGV